MTEHTSPDEDQLFEIVRRRFCDGLNSDELEEVRKGVRDVLNQADTLAAVKLNISAEPSPLFKPYASDE